MGQSPDSLEIFAAHTVSTGLYERDIAISPSGDMIIYTLGNHKQTLRCLVAMEKMENGWSTPEILPISGVYQDIEPFFTPDGNRLYFASNRPISQDSSRNDYNLWYADKLTDGWAPPVALDTIINTRGDEFYPSLSSRGNLYFTASRNDGRGLEDIFLAEYSNGKFQNPVPLDSAINSTKYEFNAYISPAEDLIIFSSYGRSDGMGGGDLYFSTKSDNGNWMEAKNMGALVNSEKLDYCPFVDWERNNFYFTSDRAMVPEHRLTSVTELVDVSNSILNGHGNIFRVSLERLNLGQ
jgi:Tol biopolymer transport system component